MRPPRPLHTENRPPYATVLNRALQGSLYFLCSLLYRGKAVISLGGASGVRVWIGKIRARRFFIVPRGRSGARLCVSPPENRRSSCAMLPRHACFTDFCSASLKAYPRRSTEKMPRVRHSRGRRRRVRRFASARARPDGRERPSNPPRPQKRPLWPATTLCRTETLIELLFHGEPQKRERSSGRRPGMKIPGRCFLSENFRLCRGIQKALALSRKYESNLPQPLPAESPPSA